MAQPDNSDCEYSDDEAELSCFGYFQVSDEQSSIGRMQSRQLRRQRERCGRQRHCSCKLLLTDICPIAWSPPGQHCGDSVL